MKQSIKVKQRFIFMTPRKVRRVADLIRGKSVVEAFRILKLTPYRASELLLKKLVEASHNYRVQHGVEGLATLVVSEIMVDEGPRMGRYKPRAQGRIYKRERRLSHMSLTVSQA
ncbi:MAG: 50S ribosomal protein L22 [Vampirovibrionales bacterium]